MNEFIRDIIHSIAFLTLFIIQKSFNHFTASLHVKLNELVSSHDSASNAVINVETKSEHEIVGIKKEYADLAQQINASDNNK